MASLTEVLAAQPNESADIAGNLGKGLQVGMQLASAKDQLESQKMKVTEQKLELQTKQATAMMNRTKAAMFAQSPAQFESMMKSNEAYANSINVPYNSEALRAAYKDPSLRLAAQKEINKVLQGGVSENPQAIIDFFGSESTMIFEYLQNASYANAQRQQGFDQQTKIENLGNASAERIAALGLKKTEMQTEKDITKEFRKESRNLDDDLKKADDLMTLVTKAKERFEKYSESSPGGTGPLVTLGGTSSIGSADAQALKSTFAALSLNSLSTMFNGMSKLADTNAERARFEASQPDLKNDDPVNEQILNDMMESAQRMRNKILEAKNRLGQESSSYSSSSRTTKTTEPALDPEIQKIVDNALKINPNADVQKIIETAKAKKGIK